MYLVLKMDEETKKLKEKYSNIEDLNNLIIERLRKLEKLKEKNIEAYPYKFDKNIKNKEIQDKYDNLEKEEMTNDEFSVAGRIMTLRKMGKASFLTIKDDTAKLQLYVRLDNVGKEKYDMFKLADIGDFFGAKGTVFKTKTGETTIKVTDLKILSKSIRPLPEKYHGIQDKELRYRKRYLDLIMNQEVMDVFKKRTFMIRALREFLDNKGFLEVETPALQVLYGGAKAKPFITHINAWDMRMFLSISPELYLKRLLVGGFEKVYSICKNFRNEGVDKSHNPEFTMMEAYQAYADYEDMMKLMEECWEHVALKVNGTTKVKHKIVQEDGSEKIVEIDVKAPWKRMSMTDAIKEYVGIDVLEMSNAEVINYVNKKGIEHEGSLNWSYAVELIFEEYCEEKIIQPTHIINHPRGSTPLCKKNKENPKLLERFESFMLGVELCNAYSELNDPIAQRRLLQQQANEQVDFGDHRKEMDLDFVESIETGMPPAGGIGFGVDRMIVMLTGVESIRDAILFPTMKPENKEDYKVLEEGDKKSSN